MISATDRKLRAELRLTRCVALVPGIAGGFLNPWSTTGNSTNKAASAAADGVILNTSSTLISTLGPNESTKSNTSSASVSFGIALETQDDFTRFLSAAAVSSHQGLVST
jgi:hypothetical protein